MPLTPIHFGINIGIYYLLSLLLKSEFTIINCTYLLIAELIDIDHIFSKPIFHPRRNPFKIHLFHKNWKILIFISINIIIFTHFKFIGFGIISHLLIDFIYTKYILKL